MICVPNPAAAVALRERTRAIRESLPDYLDRELRLIEAEAVRRIHVTRAKRLGKARESLRAGLTRYWSGEKRRVLDRMESHRPHGVKEAVPEYDYSAQLDALQSRLGSAFDLDALKAEMGDGYREALSKGWAAAFDGVQAAFGRRIENRLPIQWVSRVTDRLGDKWGKLILRTQREAIYAELKAGFEVRDTFNELLARVESVYGQRPQWDEAVVRTETNRAYGRSEHEAYTALGFEGKYWILSGSPYCYTDVCKDNADLGVIGIGEPFYDMDGGEIDCAGDAHPNDECSTGYTVGENWEPPEGVVEPGTSE